MRDDADCYPSTLDGAPISAGEAERLERRFKADEPGIYVLGRYPVERFFTDRAAFEAAARAEAKRLFGEWPDLEAEHLLDLGLEP